MRTTCPDLAEELCNDSSRLRSQLAPASVLHQLKDARTGRTAVADRRFLFDSLMEMRLEAARPRLVSHAVRDSTADLDLEGKREYLRVVSDVVWDLETELARAKAERAALMTSMQADIRHRRC
jgi:hypothetical protein